MNSFFKTFWAALLAFFAALVVLNFLTFIFFVGMIAALGSSEKVTVSDNSVLEITLEGSITDSPATSPFENFDFENMKSRASNTILQALGAIESAAVDNRIKGIYLNIKGGDISLANREELRAALVRFKESGKFIVSYNENYTQGRYYLASVADSVWLNPAGSMDWSGMSAGVMFYKGLLDKLDVQVQVLRHGSFKSAVEPYIMDKMSPENRLQMDRLVGSIWGTVVSEVAASRGMDSVKLQQYASELAVVLPEDALKLGFVDRLAYRDEVERTINTMLDAEQDDDLNTISLSGYVSATAAGQTHTSDNLVRVIYADGSIMDGTSSSGTVGSETLAEKLADARRDDDVKAVVLRVNSPGGSALASDVMWREAELLKAEKPVVVSMGGMAASGGYYISCGADIILADRMTLTGSIGVFGVYGSIDRTLENKLGVTVDVVRTNPSADMGSMYRPLSSGEVAVGMKQIEWVYSTFVGHVSAGRNMSYEAVDAIGGGRVWTGLDAKEIGLIDGFGGIREAINLAADRAGVASDFSIDQPDGPSTPFEAFVQALNSAKAARVKGELGEAMAHYHTLQSVLSDRGVQARLPYVIEIR